MIMISTATLPQSRIRCSRRRNRTQVSELNRQIHDGGFKSLLNTAPGGAPRWLPSDESILRRVALRCLGRQRSPGSGELARLHNLLAHASWNLIMTRIHGLGNSNAVPLSYWLGSDEQRQYLSFTSHEKMVTLLPFQSLLAVPPYSGVRPFSRSRHEFADYSEPPVVPGVRGVAAVHRPRGVRQSPKT